MRPLQAHCHHGLGTLYTTLGHAEQARAELSTTIDLYRAMDMTFWLPQAKAALAQLEAGCADAPSGVKHPDTAVHDNHLWLNVCGP